jgi:hypothetical protein
VMAAQQSDSLAEIDTSHRHLGHRCSKC